MPSERNEAREEFRTILRLVTEDEDSYATLKCPNCDEYDLCYKEGVGEACTSCEYSSYR